MGGVGFLILGGSWTTHNLLALWSDIFSRSGELTVSPQSISIVGATILSRIAMIIGPMLLCLLLIVLAANFAQVGFLLAPQALSPKLSRLSPITGLRRIFSLKSLVELLKSILKLVIVGCVAWSAISGEWRHVFPLVGSSPWTIGSHLGEVALRIGLRIGLVILALALLDYFYQRWEHERSLKMTKKEVKDEYKQREGDPKVKARIRQKQREMAMRRMMAAIPDADVVITNPQHLAVAIRYDRDTMAAPTVVAKGADFVAQRILEIADAHGVTILEDKPLARALYQSVEIDSQIPMALYKAVAEILAYVYRQKGGMAQAESGLRSES
jgi:flagellar biosynthetic protein FlhB